MAESKVNQDQKPLFQRFQEVVSDAIKLVDVLEDHLKKIELMNKAHQATKVKRAYMFFGAVGLLVVLLLTGFVAAAVINLVGFIYPLYASLDALKTDDTNDDTLWLTYWVIYAFFNVFESFADFALGWLPFYFFGKLAFLMFCFLPQTRGSQIVYKNFLEPVFDKYRGNVQALGSQVKDAIAQAKKAN